MVKLVENPKTKSDVVSNAIELTIGAGFLAATGPIGVGIATVGEVLIVKKAITDWKVVDAQEKTAQTS